MPNLRARVKKINKAVGVGRRGSTVPGKGVMTDTQRATLKKSGLGRMAIKAHDKMLGKRKSPKIKGK